MCIVIKTKNVPFIKARSYSDVVIKIMCPFGLNQGNVLFACTDFKSAFMFIYVMYTFLKKIKPITRCLYF